jgi:hypothetical protein
LENKQKACAPEVIYYPIPKEKCVWTYKDIKEEFERY